MTDIVGLALFAGLIVIQFIFKGHDTPKAQISG
jgi:hypothetical protein